MNLTIEGQVESLTETVNALDARLAAHEQISAAAESVRALVALVADPTGCTARVAELEHVIATAKDALAALKLAKSDYHVWINKALALLDERESKVAERETTAESAWQQIEWRTKFLEANYPRVRHLEALPSGGGRDLGSDEPQVRDAHFRPHDDESVTEVVPNQIGGSNSLTRTLRRSRRRVADEGLVP
jgi:hypothetical protein